MNPIEIIIKNKESDPLKNKVRQLYSFLKEANQLRFRPVRRLSEQEHVIRLSELPKHHSMQLFRPVRVEESLEVPDVLVRVSRPKLTRCPAPPLSIADWLLPNWDDPSEKPTYSESKNQTEINEIDEEITVTIRFDDDEQRVTDFVEWLDLREKWKAPEIIARGAMRFFEEFYTLYSKIEKEGERLELLVADGFLSWQADSGIDGSVTIGHPVLLKRVELQFNPTIPEFTIHETDREVELYSSLFLDLKNVEPAAIRNRKVELETVEYHPLGYEDTEAYLKSVALTISPTEGEFLEDIDVGAKDHPRIWRDPVLLLRKRVAGIANSVDAILDDIDQQPVFPASLEQITGSTETWVTSGLGDPSNSDPRSSEKPGSFSTSDDGDILLVNTANDEQIQIVKRLNRSGAVVVQGPPGTGKTHTISNLIGHLLSQGKSILVTAHTAKALRVLRDKVPDMLKPLCVSVLGSDQAARGQLEAAIGSITERLTSETSESLLLKSDQFAHERKELLRRKLELKHLLREAIENEYKEIELQGKTYSPADAARYIAQQKELHGWIPAGVKIGASLDGLKEGIQRLYRLGVSFDTTEEHDSQLYLPNLEVLPTESQFEMLVSDFQSLLIQDLSYGKDKWILNDRESESLSGIFELLGTEFSDDLLMQSWRPYAIVAGIHKGTERQVWSTLVEKIEKTVEANAQHALVLQHRPKLTSEISLHKQYEVLSQICGHLETGGKLGFIQMATKSDWRQFVKLSSVAAGEPTHLDHFKALKTLAELERLRFDLEELWNSLVGSHLERMFKDLGPAPEQSCRALIPEIQRCLDWHEKIWMPVEVKLKAEGLKVDELIAALPREASQISEYKIIEKFTTTQLLSLVQWEASRRKLRECEAAFGALNELVATVDPTTSSEGAVGLLLAAIKARNVDGYREALIYLRRLKVVQPLVVERVALLQALGSIAPTWANEISTRASPHDKEFPPGEISQAWLWRQLCETLEDRDKLNALEIQNQIEGIDAMLREVTRFLVDAKSWGNQLKRLQSDNSMRQALVGWLDTTKRLASTRQLDKRQTLLSEARKLMRKCADAVPVWIMPISIMAESFDPKATKFDVVIIDEASQADINALIPLYMGKQIIVVGDHEQVTPLGVGKDQTLLENLRKSMLKDIPNAHLYDNMSSIYDLARQSFGEGIRLVEHFRCVPEIIGFSNALSYDGKIRPLRESNSTNLMPACVPIRVDGIRDGDTNRGEAERIIATIKAMIKHPEYADKSIGIISMLGESQAVLIQSMIHKEIESIEVEGRRIQAGISGEFQGDERDVMFLSLVDSAVDTTPLRSMGEGAYEQTKKRYNVATSRARDQLWVMHSFDPDLHLKSTDIRYRLLQHMRDPNSSSRNFEEEVGRTESPFEREVLKRLTSAGFKVTSQWKVGYFRIDMVVEGSGKRLAIECDGDRYHPIEKLAEDMNRQAILERLGWKFARIRGSAFYRDADTAMDSIFRKLDELEILPNTEKSFDEGVSSFVLINELNDIIEGKWIDPRFHLGDSDSGGSAHDMPLSTELIASETSSEYEPSGVESAKHVSAQVVKVDIDVDQNVFQMEKAEDLKVPQFSNITTVNPQATNNFSHQAIVVAYNAYAGPACPDPRVVKIDDVVEGLKGIIEAEGPVQTKRVFDIFLRSCGIKRMGHDLRDTLKKALDSLKNSKSVSSHQYMPEEDFLAETVWTAQQSHLVVRKRGDRTLEEIPLSELEALSNIVASNKNFLSIDEHMRSMLDALELKRLTSTAELILKRAINGSFTRIS